MEKLLDSFRSNKLSLNISNTIFFLFNTEPVKEQTEVLIDGENNQGKRLL